MGIGAQRPIFITFLSPGFSFLLHNFIFCYFWLHWVLVATLDLSSCGEWGYPPVAVSGLLVVVASPAVEPWL